jgi:hypothetical protein
MGITSRTHQICPEGLPQSGDGRGDVSAWGKGDPQTGTASGWITQHRSLVRTARRGKGGVRERERGGAILLASQDLPEEGLLHLGSRGLAS